METGALTEVALAARTGFRQGYISKFLNHKRGLSLDGMDRILEAERLSIHDLLEPRPLDPEFDGVPLAAAEHSMEPRLEQFATGSMKFARILLESLRPSVFGSKRWEWERFLVISPNPDDVEAMHPRLPKRCAVLLDRHYNSLQAYRRGERSVFAVSTEAGIVLRYADCLGEQLILRAEDPRLRAQAVTIPVGKEFHDLIAGRVAWVGAEL